MFMAKKRRRPKPERRPERPPSSNRRSILAGTLFVAAIAFFAGRAALAPSLPPAPNPYGVGPGTGDPLRDGEIRLYVASLDAKTKQALSNALAIYNESAVHKMPSPRALVGDPAAPMRVTYWTDSLGRHSAELHQTLARLKERQPAGAVALEPRHFPRDAACNPHADERHDPSIACVAARTQICVEGRKGAFEYASALFGARRAEANGAVGFSMTSALSPLKIFELAGALAPRAELEACMALPETEAKLADDIALAVDVGAKTAPFVVVNGRRGTNSVPFLELLALTQGRGFHPAFALLPAPDGRRP